MGFFVWLGYFLFFGFFFDGLEDDLLGVPSALEKQVCPATVRWHVP